MNPLNKSILATLALSAALALTGCGGGSSTAARVDDRDNTCGIPNWNADMLAQVNARRAAGAMCGSTAMPAVGPLSWNINLQWAATRHAYDMAAMNRLTHTGSDGSNWVQRAKDAGYSGDANVENGAGPGVVSVSGVIDAWMQSPGHCRGVMSATSKDLGVSCAGGYADMLLGAIY